MTAAFGAGRRAGVSFANVFFEGALRAAVFVAAFLAGAAFLAATGRFVTFVAAGAFLAVRRALGFSAGRLAVARADLDAAERAFTVLALFSLLAAFTGPFAAGRELLAVLTDLAAFLAAAFGSALAGRAGLAALAGALLRAVDALGLALAAVRRDFGFSAAFGAAFRPADSRDGLALVRTAASLAAASRTPFFGAAFALATFFAGAFVFTFAVTLRIF